jgi:hypothetical protein
MGVRINTVRPGVALSISTYIYIYTSMYSDMAGHQRTADTPAGGGQAGTTLHTTDGHT